MDATPPSADRPAPPKAVLFDVYGTLLDVYSVGLRAEQMFPGAGERLARAWRDKQIEYSRLVSMSGRYRPFWQLTRDALQVTAQALGLPLDTAGEDSLMNQYRHLSAFPENRAVLQALAERGIRTGVLSNGDPDMLDVTLRSAALTDLIDPILSVHATRRYKTDPAAYALGPDALGLPAAEILFVSSNCWDAIGAAWYGYTTLWVNRAGAPMEQLGITPTRVGSSLRDVLEFF
jgi:2-haloacid dehalogenase